MKKEINLLKEIADIASCITGDDLSEKDAQNILDLIESQQQEIEELQKYMKTNLIPRSTINLLYISTDKIKEKIEEIEKYMDNTVERSTINEYKCAISFLEELLGE